MADQGKVYDFIIVGSGMGGLLTALILAKEGFSVLVLEKNHQIGGALQVFSRDKRIFDTGVHYIGSLDEGETLRRIFDYAGITDGLKMRRLDEDCFDSIHLPNGLEISHGQGYSIFKRNLKAVFPEESEAIESFCEKIQWMCTYFPLYNLEEANESPNYISHPEVLEIGAWDYVSSITTNEKLKMALLGTGLLYAGDRKRTPLFVVALIMNSYIKGSYRMVDGGSQIAKLLSKEIHNHGGEILKHQEVVRALYAGDNISAVVTNQGDTFKARRFISNLHPLQSVEIFGKEHFRLAYRKRLAKAKNTVSSFTLYLSLKKDMIPYLNHNVYVYTTDEIWDTVDYEQENWPQAMFICTPATSTSEDFADSMSVMCYMNYDEVKQWSASHNTIGNKGERSKDYYEFKSRKEQQVIDQLQKVFPEINNAIEGVYSSTPLTYRDYIGTSDGSLYGVEKDYRNIILSKIHAKTNIPNLYQTGQNLVFHGILGTAIGALVTCFNFVDSSDLIDKIKNAK